MWIIVWKYKVIPAKLGEFESIYDSHGEWATLFSKASGYIETRLLRDTDDESTYITFDCWRSEEDFQRFKIDFASEYDTLDKKCEHLTQSEQFVGAFASILSDE